MASRDLELNLTIKNRTAKVLADVAKDVQSVAKKGKDAFTLTDKEVQKLQKSFERLRAVEKARHREFTAEEKALRDELDKEIATKQRAEKATRALQHAEESMARSAIEAAKSEQFKDPVCQPSPRRWNRSEP